MDDQKIAEGVQLGLATLTEQPISNLDEGFENIVKGVERAKLTGGPILLFEDEEQGFYLEVRFLTSDGSKLEFLHSFPVELSAVPADILAQVPEGYGFDRVVWAYHIEYCEGSWKELRRFARLEMIENTIMEKRDSITWN